MKVTIDKAGHLVVPKAIRKAAQLAPGTELEIRLAGGRVEIEPVPLDVKLERRGRLVVAVPRHKAPKLTTSQVEATIEELRESR